MVSLSRRLTVLETMASSVDRLAISRLTDAELDAKIAAGEAEIVAAGGWDAYFGADRDLAIVFQVELRGSTKFMEEFSAAGFAQYLSLLRTTFEEGQRAGVFRRDLNSKIVAKVLFGALDEMATNWIISRRRYQLEPMVEPVMDVFLNGVNA